MRRMRRSTQLTVVLLTLALVAAACGGGKKKTATPKATTTTQANAPKGGTLVLGADQEPLCGDAIGACGAQLWAQYVFEEQVMARAFDMTSLGKQVPSDVLTGLPDLVTTPKQKVTYHINPKAVWSDGQPILCADFLYSWDQEDHDQDINDRSGYKNISGIDCPDPKTAVANFSAPYADWRSLFSGFTEIWPSHLLKGKNRDALVKDGFKWSGGPWMLDHWTKGQELKLVPNPAYWGKKPNLDAVVWKFPADSAAQVADYKSGQFAAIYPQAQLLLALLKNQPNTFFKPFVVFNYEDLWFNTSKPPLDSKAVRQALAYATDRDAIVSQLFGPVGSLIKPIQSYTTQVNKTWYSTEFSKYKRDLSKVDSLMKGDGWTKGPDGIWAKGGKKAAVELNTTAGNKRRELTEQVLQSEWKEAGFTATVNNTKAGTLFGQWLPAGTFDIGIFAQTPSSPHPSATMCSNFCTLSIPTTANGNSGQDYTRYNDAAVTTKIKGLDTELLATKAKADLADIMSSLVEAVPSLPVDPLPQVFVVNTAKVGGYLEAGNPIYGPFVNLNEWYCKGGTC